MAGELGPVLLLPNAPELLVDPEDPKLLFVPEPKPLFVPVPIVDGPSPGPEGLSPPVVTTFWPKNPRAGRDCPN